MNKKTLKAIGGYFELELPKGKGILYPDAKKYQSARAAFYALLLKIKPACVWMPFYICDSMLAPLEKANIKIKFYSLNLDLSIKDDFKLKKNEYLLYVNYFGICEKIQEEILEKYTSDKIIFDHSQAFFQPPKNCLATIYSPRKFFGVPDGGLLVTNLDINEPLEIDTESINRASHLLKRLAGEPEDGYLDFRNNDDSLNDFEPKKMSLFTERILNSIDYKTAKKTRNRNFKYLSKKLEKNNILKINSKSIDGPMGYPFLRVSNNLKKKLIESRVFIPTYWPEVISRLNSEGIEENLVENLKTIPCDQRNDISSIKKLVEIINEY